MSKKHEIGPASTRWRCRWEALKSIGTDVLNFLSIPPPMDVPCLRPGQSDEIDVTGRLLVSVFIPPKEIPPSWNWIRPAMTPFITDPFIFYCFLVDQEASIWSLSCRVCHVYRRRIDSPLGPLFSPPPKCTEGSSVANGSVDFFGQRSGTKNQSTETWHGAPKEALSFDIQIDATIICVWCNSYGRSEPIDPPYTALSALLKLSTAVSNLKA